MQTRFNVLEMLSQACAVLRISVDAVVLRTGFSPEMMVLDATEMPPEIYFRLAAALCEESGDPNPEFRLAKALAQGPFSAPIFGFSCAETLALGLLRLREFKPLMGPKRLTINRPRGALEVIMQSTDPLHPLPARFGLFEIVLLTEYARTFTGADIAPIATSLPEPLAISDEVAAFIGGMPKIEPRVRMVFSADDADRPLLTRSPALWSQIEPVLMAELAGQLDSASLAKRVQSVLTEALPGGASSVDAVARRLGTSKRSMQRRLKEEGTSFQKVLAITRADISTRYLSETDLSLPEISYLLGFSDTSSFFRAFYGWKGVTPGEFRARQSKPAIATG